MNTDGPFSYRPIAGTHGLYQVPEMIAALDVSYNENDSAVAAAVVFAQFADAEAVSQYTATVSQTGAYVPGQFFKRELPCLLTVLEKVTEKLDTVVVDGYVTLGDQPGLGYHLWEKLGRRVAVIGVAKRPFAGADSVNIFRGKSSRPLHVTAIGIDPLSAADRIAGMHGPHRMPTLLRRADDLASERCGSH
jgi:deoxyribonuclease V